MFAVSAALGIGIKRYRSQTDGEGDVELAFALFFAQTTDIGCDFGVKGIDFVGGCIGKLVQRYPIGLINVKS